MGRDPGEPMVLVTSEGGLLEDVCWLGEADLFLLFRPSTDWMRLTPMVKGDSNVNLTHTHWYTEAVILKPGGEGSGEGRVRTPQEDLAPGMEWARQGTLSR